MQETDLARGTTWIKAKGRREKELVPLPKPVIDALGRYLRWRGPLWPVRCFKRVGSAAKPGAAPRDAVRATDRRGAWAAGRAARLVSFVAAYQHHPGGRTRAESWLGLDKIRAHSRHRSIATLMLYVREHDRQRTQATLMDLVHCTLGDRPSTLTHFPASFNVAPEKTR